MLCNVSPGRHPHALLFRDVLHEVPQSLCSTSLARDSRMQRNIHHLASFSIEHVECGLEILLVQLSTAGCEAWRHMKLAIVAVVVVRLRRLSAHAREEVKLC